MTTTFANASLAILVVLCICGGLLFGIWERLQEIIDLLKKR